MARISTYPIDATPSIEDKVIGTEVNNENETKNYTIGDILSLIVIATPTQQALAALPKNAHFAHMVCALHACHHRGPDAHRELGMLVS